MPFRKIKPAPAKSIACRCKWKLISLVSFIELNYSFKMTPNSYCCELYFLSYETLKLVVKANNYLRYLSLKFPIKATCSIFKVK